MFSAKILSAVLPRARLLLKNLKRNVGLIIKKVHLFNLLINRLMTLLNTALYNSLLLSAFISVRVTALSSSVIYTPPAPCLPPPPTTPQLPPIHHLQGIHPNTTYKHWWIGNHIFWRLKFPIYSSKHLIWYQKGGVV